MSSQRMEAATIPLKELRLTVNAILRRYAKSAIRKYPGRFTRHQQRVLHKLIDCRTVELGCQAFHCGDCGEDAFRYNSCHDRHCTTCGSLDRDHWRERMLTMQLPVQSLHLVFTLPHEFNPLIVVNQDLMNTIFLQAVTKTLTRVLKKDFGCEPGMVMVLHTWGQRMNPHYHCHLLVFAGGSSPDGTQWIDVPTDVEHPICPERLSKYFRKCFTRRLRGAFAKTKLTMPDAMRYVTTLPGFDRWLTPILAKQWKVHSQKPPAHCHDAQAAIKYLSHYISGTAISNYRIVADDGKYVTIRVKSYRRKCHFTLRMTGEEFVIRFVFHILPPRCMRVRYGGFLGNRFREQRLALCRSLLGVPEGVRGDESLMDGGGMCATGTDSRQSRDALPSDLLGEAEASACQEERQRTLLRGSLAKACPPAVRAALPPNGKPLPVPPDQAQSASEERFPRRCPRCGHPCMTGAGRYNAEQTRRMIAEQRAFWARLYTVASTFDDLLFAYPRDLPRPET